MARYLQHQGSLTNQQRKLLTDKATSIAKRKQNENFLERWGACHYLVILDRIIGTQYSKFLLYQTPFTQALLAPVLPRNAYVKGHLAERYLRRTSIEPGLSICARLHALKIIPMALGVADSDMCSQVRNTLCELGLLKSNGSEIDPIAELLRTRYGMSSRKSWRTLLGGEYVHALGILKQAEATFFSGPSYWLATQSSFNQTLFLSVQSYLKTTGLPGAVTTTNRNGELIDFGVTLDRNNQFSKHYPNIANCFREMNTRRNLLPVAHPYEKKNAGRNRYLKSQERSHFAAQLRVAYTACADILP